MIRTQVYLPEDLYRELKLLANTSGVNFSSLIRQGAEKVIKVKPKKKNWMKFAGTIKGGSKDVASRIDYYLYGDGNPKYGKGNG